MVPIGDPLIALMRAIINSPGAKESRLLLDEGRRFVEGMPELYVVSNVVKDGEPIGSLGHGEAVWHTDMSYLPDPPMASMLYALEIPPAGGNTGFVNMYAIYEALPVNAEFGWHTAWQVGDLVLWDNRCTMHRRDPLDPAARRIMHRTQIKGKARPSA
jgi:alpha-ketoglutarate-dependent taurine dioxygenase